MVFAFFFLPDYSIFKAKNFDQKVWFEQERIYHPEPGVYGWIDCTRGRMYEDLDKNHLKKYMTKEEVEALLGHSTVAREYPDSWIFNSLFKCFQYKLGTCIKGPSSIIRFCSLKGLNLYSHELTDLNDGGSELLEDNKEYELRHEEMVKRNEEARRLRIEKEKNQVKGE